MKLSVEVDIKRFEDIAAVCMCVRTLQEKNASYAVKAVIEGGEKKNGNDK